VQGESVETLTPLWGMDGNALKGGL
jgi:hypothetical protein